jgi:hypothetical protein
MSFLNEIFKISLFRPEGVERGQLSGNGLHVKSTLKNTKPASYVKAVKWKKTIKIRDQNFLATRIPPSPYIRCSTLR